MEYENLFQISIDTTLLRVWKMESVTELKQRVLQRLSAACLVPFMMQAVVPQELAKRQHSTK